MQHITTQYIYIPLDTLGLKGVGGYWAFPSTVQDVFYAIELDNMDYGITTDWNPLQFYLRAQLTNDRTVYKHPKGRVEELPVRSSIHTN